MQIGTVTIESKLALAPMAGVTDAAFRQICSELGAGYTVTELVSAKALCYHDAKTAQLLFYQIWKEFTESKTFDTYQYKSVNSLNGIRELVHDIDAYLEGNTYTPVSYTHLTLPTIGG